MFKNTKKKYVQWGLTLFIVFAASVLLTMMLSRIDSFRGWMNGIFAAFSPIVWGLVIAYILNPVASKLEDWLTKLFGKRLKERTAIRLARAISVFASILLAVFCIFGVIMLIVPQLVESIGTLIDNGRSYYTTVEGWINRQFENYPTLQSYAEQFLGSVFDSLQNWVQNKLLPSAQSIMTAVATGVFSAVKKVLNFLIGLIVAAYMLAGKNRYLAQVRKLNAATFSAKAADRLLEIARHANRVFGGFIRGKLLDSAIMGVLCYIGAVILRLPYAILVATIVGVTNVIPFFGPLIGAVPSAFIILIVSPIKCLYFLIFVLLLQQLDGNVIGPRILGDTTGLSSFWVLVSITVFSGLFGFAGMLLGVPVFAVLYILVKEIAESKLQKKGLPVSTLDYYDPPLQPQETQEPEEAGEEEQNISPGT